jgi:hypothetical protein
MDTPNSFVDYSIASADLLFLPHIASWQIAKEPAVKHKIVAALPALQRGAVWKPQQIEALWDSIIRGFPIGSFLLSPFDPDRGLQAAKHQQCGIGQPNYHLLDGQQRSTAITLAFLNPWTTEEAVKAVLWVDIAEPHHGSDLEYVFRVVTQAHPWGYKRTEPGSPITVGNIRDALDCYRKATPGYKEPTSVQFPLMPLTHTWPWDSQAPIPLSILVEEILSKNYPEDTLHKRLLERVEKLPFWGEGKLEWQHNVLQMLYGIDESLFGRFNFFVRNLRKILQVDGAFGVPVLMLPHMTRIGAVENDKQDPVETLFIRVNSQGTVLDGEELIYSILKSNWPDAPAFIDKMQYKLAVPSRLLLLSTRLMLAKGQKDKDRPPTVPSVSQFRRLIYGLDNANPNFRANLESFVKGEGIDIFGTAQKLLTGQNSHDTGYALPAVLAGDLAQKHSECMFLLLSWIMRMRVENFDPLQITQKNQRRMLGFLTSMAWFAADREKALSAVWQYLQTIDPKNLPSFFSRTAFIEILKLDKRDNLQMRPLPSPDVLEKVIQDCVTSGRGVGGYGGFGDPQHDFWRKWTRWEWMSGRLSNGLSKWYEENLRELWERTGNGDEEPLSLKLKYQESWTQFIDKLWHERSVLLYAQRDWLNAWFPNYDPAQPDQIEDMNRPWDYDHIHPQRFLRNDKGNSQRNIPNIIWDWHSSIGNLRAWPLEANRSDSDDSPEKKLTIKEKSESNYVEKIYAVDTNENKLKASFVSKDVDWEFWQNSVPQNEDYPRQYLAKPSDYGECRKALIRAITKRFLALYREWYESLMISDLMPK